MYRLPPAHLTALLAVPFLLLAPEPGVAQTQTFTACRVPDVGAIYMIGVEGAPSSCLDASHVEFSWTEGGAVADGSIGTAQLADGAVTSAKLASDVAVGVEDGSIGTAKLADLAVTSVKIALNAVNSSRVADNSLTQADIATNGVGAAEIAAGAVGSSEIADNSVASADILNGTVANVDLTGGGAPLAGYQRLEYTYSAGPGLVHSPNTSTCAAGRVAISGGMRIDDGAQLTGADGLGPLADFWYWGARPVTNQRFEVWFSNFSSKTVGVRIWVLCAQGTTTASS